MSKRSRRARVLDGVRPAAAEPVGSAQVEPRVSAGDAPPQPQNDRVLGLYAIYDLVAGEIVGNSVMLFPHIAPARRMFRDACQNPMDGKNRIAQAPADYALVYLGVVSIWSLSVVDTGAYYSPVDSFHKAVVCTGDQVLQ